MRSFFGHETDISRSQELKVARVEHPPKQRIEAHAHDWPCLTLHRCGSYVEQSDSLAISISRPAAVYYPAGWVHSNVISSTGLNTVSILFDPAILKSRTNYPMNASNYWIGGLAGKLASLTARKLICDGTDQLDTLAAFFNAALMLPVCKLAPPWLERIEQEIAGGVTSTAELAAHVGLSPAWLAHAYLQATGESIQSNVRRRRAEHALNLIRSTDHTFAAIAAEAGFCDQSHMVRAFQALLGRTPSEIRAVAADRLPMQPQSC